jgi:predicted ChrR family anti-sigma factor
MKRHDIADEEMNERAALYALGALSQHEARAFEKHLEEGCETCEEEVRDFTGVVAALAFDATEQAPPEELRDRLCARIAKASRPASQSQTTTETPSRDLLTVRAGEGEWHELTAGIFIKQLFADKERGTVTSLYRMMPGARVPRHKHLGIEECYVIEGDFHTSMGILGAGDYQCANTGSIHEPLYTVTGATLLIIASQGVELMEHV